MQLRKAPLVFVIVLSLAVSPLVFASAQARLQGIVTDSKGSPLAGVVITITCDDVSTYQKVLKTDKKGEFKTLILDATRYYKFLIELEGYQSQELPFKVGAGSTDNHFPITLASAEEAAAQGRMNQNELPGYKELEEGKVLFEAGDREGARLKFAAAVAAQPDLLTALIALAELSYEAGLWNEAMDAARKCLDQDDESVDCLAIAANVSQELGDAEAHTEYMARYQAANPNDPTILYNNAANALNALDDDGAKPFLEQCLEADPEFPQCNFEYGMLLLRTGDMEGAKKYLEKYLEVAPDGPDAATATETIKYL